MMTPDDVQTVTKVYRKFYASDNMQEDWTPIDDCMEALGWLSDVELIQESELKIQKQKSGKPKCYVDHPGQECFVPMVLDAVEAILNLYQDTGNLHENNKFVLQYYLSLSQVGAIKY